MTNSFSTPGSGEPVEIVDYDPKWPVLFLQEHELIQAALGTFALDVQHIGSTAVPNLAAKPVIDIVVGVRTLELPPEQVTRLAAIGYEYRGEADVNIDGDIYLRKGAPRTHQLHLSVLDGEFWTNHLLFREYLREHEDIAKQYEALKRHLAIKHRTERLVYTDAKTDFILEVLAAAKQEGKPNLS